MCINSNVSRLHTTSAIVGSILEYAETVIDYENIYIGTSTTDIPDEITRYTIAHIERQTNNISISIISRNSRIYTNYKKDYGKWTGWRSCAFYDELLDVKSMFSKSDITDSSVSINDYFEIIKNKWINLPNGNYFQRVTSRNTAMSWIYKENSNHGAVLIIGYSIVNKPIYAILTSGVWTKY